jgi:hypothetical protein
MMRECTLFPECCRVLWHEPRDAGESHSISPWWLVQHSISSSGYPNTPPSRHSLTSALIHYYPNTPSLVRYLITTSHHSSLLPPPDSRNDVGIHVRVPKTHCFPNVVVSFGTSPEMLESLIPYVQHSISSSGCPYMPPSCYLPTSATTHSSPNNSFNPTIPLSHPTPCPTLLFHKVCTTTHRAIFILSQPACWYGSCFLAARPSCIHWSLLPQNWGLYGRRSIL